MTTALLDPDTREQLRSRTVLIEELVGTAERGDRQPEPGKRTQSGGETRSRWYGRLENAVLDLASLLPAGIEDYEVAQLLRFLTELRRAIDADHEASDTDGRVALAAMKMLDVAKRIERRLNHARLEDEHEAARYIFETLPDISAGDQAALLGVSTKTIGHWRQGKPVHANRNRVKLVAQLVSYLRRSMTQTGVVMWFQDEREFLDGHSPMDLLEAGEARMWSELVSYARGGRGQLAE